MEQEHQFIDYIEQSIIKNWDKDALTDYKGITLQYKDVARKIAKFHIVLESAGIQPGDKIAVCGRNSAHWGVTFLATITYGAVIVPILHEFKADNIHNIVNHSEAKLLFVGDQAWENLNEDAMPLLEGIASLTDFTALVSRNEKLTYAFEHRNAIYGQRYPKNFRQLEIDDGDTINSNAEKLLNIANANGENLYIKTDGSLDEGLELVTHPMTLEYHLNEMPWAEVLRK